MDTADRCTKELIQQLLMPASIAHISAHGSADVSELHLQDRILAADSFRAQVADDTAPLRLLILDTCTAASSSAAFFDPSTGRLSGLVRRLDGGDASVAGANRSAPAIGAVPQVARWMDTAATSWTSYSFAGTTDPDRSASVPDAMPLPQIDLAPPVVHPPWGLPAGDLPRVDLSTATAYSAADKRVYDLYRLVVDPLLDLPVEPQPPHLVRVIKLDLSAELRRDLLRLIDGIRSALRLALILLQAALTRQPVTRCFLLALLAVSRHYGRRSEPDGHLLPARMPMSVVRGELVLAC